MYDGPRGQYWKDKLYFFPIYFLFSLLSRFLGGYCYVTSIAVLGVRWRPTLLSSLV